MAVLESSALGRIIRRAVLLRRAVVVGALIACTPAPAQAQAGKPIDYQVKAVFLFNFAHFVEWPPDAFADPLAPIVIGVLGGDPFGPYLKEVIANETVNNRPLVFRHFRQVEDIDVCHILFISESEGGRLNRVFQTLKGRSILTVGDGEDFARNGGVIRFFPENNKIRIRVNLGVARNARVTISSKILRSADVIGTEPNR